MSSNGGDLGGDAPRPMRAARSITSRLVALFTASSAVLLGCVVGVFYRGVALHLGDEHRHLLAEVVRILQLTPPAQARDWLLKAGRPRGEFGPGGAAVVERYSFRILFPSGGGGVESPGMTRVPPAAFNDIGVALQGPLSVGTSWRSPDGIHFLLATTTLQGSVARHEAATIQVALDVTPDDELLAELRVRGALLLLAGIATSGVAGAIVARRGLRPIERVTAEMSRISAQQLQQQLDRRAFPRELHRLVDAFSGMLDRLDRAFTDVSAYSGNLAHELRTPLSNLRGEAEVALLRARTVDEYREVLGSSLEELKRLSRMVDALLFLARADRREAALNRKAVSLAAESRAVVEFYLPLAEEKGASLRVAGEACAELDPDLFRRALANLVANSLRNVRRGGRVAVEARELEDGAAEVRVVDDGCGIAEADLPYVFERFYRGRERDSCGAGLGLAIVRSIVELHDGQVVIASTPGAGTEVTMRFPPRSAH